mgnify:CR=1 FL=1
MKRHEPEGDFNKQHCLVCGAIRDREMRGRRWTPWELRGKPQPYCPGNPCPSARTKEGK